MDLVSLQVATSSSGDQLPYFETQATLDGDTYTLELRWNIRWKAWYLNIWDETEQTLLLAGWRVGVNYPVGNWITGRLPAGALVFADTSNQGLDPGLGDLGVRVQLYYATAAELALLG